MSRSTLFVNTALSIRRVRPLFLILFALAAWGGPLLAAVRTPGVATSGWRRGIRNTTYAYDVAVTNHSDETRTLCVATRRSPGLSGRIDNVTTGDPATDQPCQSYAAGQTRPVTLTYTMANSDWDGDAIQTFVKAYDQAASTYAAEEWFKITVDTAISAPANEVLASGQTYRRYFSVWNTDPTGTARTYGVQFTGDDVVTNVQGETPTLTIPANSYRDAYVTFTMAAGTGGRMGRLMLKVVDVAYPEREGTAVVTHTSAVPDTTPPTITFNRASGTVGSPSFQLTIDAKDDQQINRDSFRIYHNGSDVTSYFVTTFSPPAWVQSSTTGQLVAGVNAIRVTVSDAAGNATESTLTVTYSADATPPAITFNKTSGTTQATPSFQLTIDARDDREINRDSLRIYHNGSDVTGYFVTTFSPPSWLQSSTTGQLVAGLNSIKVTVADTAGNVAENTLDVTYSADATPPAITFNKASGTTQTAPSFQLTVDARDDQAVDRDSLRIFHNGTDVTTVFVTTFSPPAWLQSSTTVQLSPGSNTFRVAVVDAAGNAAEVSLGVTYATGSAPPATPATKFTAYSMYTSNIGNSNGIPIQYGGLDARQDRQWIHWTGCAPNWYPNGDPDLGYDLAAIQQFATANRGRLFIFLDEPAHGSVGNHKTNYTTPGCTQVTPAQYARAYRKFVDEVRSVDPTARFSPGGFEQVRATLESYPTAFVEYATEFYDSYVSQYGAAPPVTEWRFHMYWENGAWGDPSDITGWKAKTERAVAFAQQHGAPLVLAIGYPWQAYDPRMLDGMDRMFSYLDGNATVSSVFWWSYDFWQDGQNRLTTFDNEATTARTLTALGERYRALIAGATAPPPPSTSPVSVTPDGTTVHVAPNSSGTRTFTVQNVGTASVTYRLTQSCSGAVTACGAPSLAEVALAPAASAAVTVAYSMTASGSGTLTLTATQVGSAGVTDTGSYQLTALPPTAFTIDLAPHNGENVDLADYAANLTYTTPGYVSLDQERAVTLFYSSAQAAPSGLVQVDVEDASASPPEQYSILLRTAAGDPVRLSNGALESFYRGASGVTRLAAHFERVSEAWLPTGAHTLTVVVRKWRGGQVYEEATQPVRVLIVNERGNPVGRGWSIAGLQRIHRQADGSLLVTAGDGTAQYYARPAACGSTCTYVRPRGVWSDITYDGTNFIRSYPGGGNAVFGSDGVLLRTETKYGARTQYTFTSGALTRIVDPTGHAITLTYGTGAAGALRLHTIVDPGSRLVAVSHDGSDQVTGILDPANTAELRAIGYDADSRLIGWTDRAGGRWDVAYDSAGMLAVSTAPAIHVGGQEARPVTRSKSLHAAVLAPPDTGTSLLTAAPNLAAADVQVSLTDARENTTQLKVDRFGSPVWVKDPVGRITTIERNADSQEIRVVGPAGHVISNSWDGHLLTRTVDETLGTTVHYEYEPEGWRRVRRVWGDVPETTYLYETRPGALYGTDSVTVRRSATEVSTTRYGIADHGRVAHVTDPEGHGTFYGFSGQGSLDNTTSVMTGSSQSSYRRGAVYSRDSFGRVTHIHRREPVSGGTTDTLQRVTEYDLVNRITSETDAAQQKTVYGYAGEHGLRTVTDPKGQVYTFDRNVLGWVEQETDPAGRTIRYTYDAAGNVQSRTNRRDQAVSFGYDAANRVTHRDADGARTSWTYHPDHRRVTVTNPESTDEFVIDAAGRPDLTKIRRGSLTITLDETVNRRGQREELTLSGPWSPARSIGYGYTEGGQFARIRDFNGEHTSLVRNGDGQVTRTYYPRFAIINELGSLHAVSSHHYSGLSTSTPNPGVGYNFDGFGRTSERYPSATPTRYWKYRYDLTSRLKAAEEWERAPDVCTMDPDRGMICEPDPGYSPLPRPRRTYTYAYDAVGNPAGSVGATVQAGNRLTGYKGFVMQYDADGNLALRYTPDWWTFNQTLTWNSLGQLTEVNGVSYGYDGLGRRVRRTAGGITRYYVYDHDDLVMELGSDGSVQREYVHFPGTDQPHSVRFWQYGEPGSTFYYAMQSPGNVSALIDLYGSVVKEYRYDPFGNAEPGFENHDSQNPLRFAGREWDLGVGLYYIRNRWYDPVLERFISEDPIRLLGGLNLYSYTENDPVNHRDPSGLLKACGTVWFPEGIGIQGCDDGSTKYIDLRGGSGDTFGRGSPWRGTGTRGLTPIPPGRRGNISGAQAEAIFAQVGELTGPYQLPLEIAGTIATAPLTSTGSAAMTVLRIGPTAGKYVVVGRGMWRVRLAAARFGAESFENPFFEPGVMNWASKTDVQFAHFLNAQWLIGKINAGYKVIDIGDGAMGPSTFYELEQWILHGMY